MRKTILFLTVVLTATWGYAVEAGGSAVFCDDVGAGVHTRLFSCESKT